MSNAYIIYFAGTLGSTSLQVSENNGSSVFVELLRGRDGLTGRDGPTGPPGPAGLEGAQEPRGYRGYRGLEGPPGPQGANGTAGPQGPPGPLSGGAVYTRWGKSSCPSTAGTEMVYSGITGGIKYSSRGGGANHLCMRQEREYSDELTYRAGVQGYAYIWGTQYDGAIDAPTKHTVSCTVCYVSARPTVLMIPGKASCPPTWTREYFGYLITDSTLWGNHEGRSMYECVDKDQQSLLVSPNFGSVLYPVEADCSSGLPCPANTDYKEINCVVCTK